jgi:tetratricopeptide (TPR) repeat protein
METSTRRAHTAAALAVLAAAVVPFAGTLGHGFALDDAAEVVDNEHVRSLRNVPRMFVGSAWEGSGVVAPIYRPLTTATYALNHAAAGLEPWAFHLVNVALHAGVALLVLALALRLGLSPLAAGAGALLFAIHPVHVEVVANVAGRKDALATAFVLLAVLAHASRRSGPAQVALACVAFAAALLSKESGIAALSAFVAWDLLFRREAWKEERGRTVLRYCAYAATLAAYLLARRAAVGSAGIPLATISPLENPLAHVELGTRLLTGIAVLGRGLALLVFPATLSPDYSYAAIPLVETPFDLRFLASAAAIAAIAWLSFRGARRLPLLAFAVLWYGASILPTSNLLFPVGTIFGERLLYLPSVALALAAGEAVRRVLAARRPALRRLAWASGIAVAALLSARTFAYASTWSDDLSLFSEAVRAVPRSVKAHQLLGSALIERGRIAEGVAHLETAVHLQSPLPGAPARTQIELGVAYERSGRVAAAEAVYAAVLRREPDHPDALWRLGVVRWLQDRTAEAAALWERTLAVSPGHARAMADLGLARERQGDLSGAEALWIRAAQVDPRIAGPWLWLGDLYESRGDLPRAHAAWREFLARARFGAYADDRQRILRKLAAAPSRRPR